MFLVNLSAYEAEELAPWTGNVFKHLYYNLPDPVVSFDLKGHIVTANPAVTKLLGWKRSDLSAAAQLYNNPDDFLFRVRELVISKGRLTQSCEP